MATLPRDLTARFQQALSLAEAGQGPQARAQLLECVVADPGNPHFVAEWLAHLAEHSPPDSASANQPPVMELEQAHGEQNWTAVLTEGPRQLATQPWHLATLLALADACAAQNYDDAGLAYLRHGLHAASDNAAINRRLGRLLARQGLVAEALACWQRVEATNPDDLEAARMISHLTVRQCRQRAGLEVAPAPATNGHRPKARTAAPAQPARPTGDIVTSTSSGDLRRTPIQQLEAALREMPSNPEYYLQLTPLYLEKGREYDAEKMLAEGRKSTDDEPRVRKLWEDVSMQRLQKRIALAQRQSEGDAVPEARASLVALCEERDHLETEIFLGRCKREPDNALLKFELGMRFKQAGKLREARAKFDEALADPASRGLAAFEIGACLEHTGDYPEALKFYRLSAQAAELATQIDCRQKALYQAGGLAVRLKLHQLAERYLGELLKLDPHYLDAAAWLKEIRKG